jgi:thiamine-phosphate pyrophosphorylase
MSTSRTIVGLHVITDAPAIAEAAAAAGAAVVQVRAKNISDRALFDLAHHMVEICAAHGVTCIVNDRLDVALAAGAHGTHLGADDVPVAAARRVAGTGHLIGATAREPRRAAELVAEGADYVGVGPAFATTTKDGLPPPLGPAGIAAVVRAVTVPVVAIGGVTAQRVPELLGAGVLGIAVVGAIAGADDAGRATRVLLRALDRER